MKISNMNGPYLLESDKLNELGTDLYDEGVYVLIRTTDKGKIKRYIGRTNDQTLYVRLSAHAGKNKYKKFWYDVVPTLKGRFNAECELYHNYKNEIRHPERPKGKTWNCPVSGCNELD